jgi:glucose-fructose oxidoreductase
MLPWEQANQLDRDAFVILANKPLPVPGEEGLRDIRIVEAILESEKYGKKTGSLNLRYHF